MLAIGEEILPPITVLMTLMVLGLALGRFGIFRKEFNRGLNFLLLKITLPCLIVISMQKPFTEALAVQGAWAWLVSFVLYAALFVVSGFLVRWTRFEADKKGVYRFVIMFSNVGFMGFPLMEALWGRNSVFLAPCSTSTSTFLSSPLGSGCSPGTRIERLFRSARSFSIRRFWRLWQASSFS